MKKRGFALVLMIVLLLTMSVQAVEMRASAPKPFLEFNGTTAYCSADCICDGNIEATLTLYQGSSYVSSWSDLGKNYVSLYGSCSVESGKSYTLTLTYSINGTEKPAAYTTKICP